MNGQSIEIYQYENDEGRNFIGDPEDITDRQTFGKKREEKTLRALEIADTGELISVDIDGYGSLEEKLKHGFITEEEYNKRKLKSVMNANARRKTKVRRLIEANISANTGYPVFLTLTYKENMLDREVALKDLDKFLKRVCYKFAEEVGENPKRKWLKYVGVLERQLERGKKNGDAGAWHFHLVLFNFPYVEAKVLQEIWGLGALNIKSVKKNTIEEYRKMIGYMCKYITKTFYDDMESEKKGQLVAAKEQNGYFRSKGLIEPQVIYFAEGEEAKIESMLSSFSCGYENRFENDYTGSVLYKHYYKQDEGELN